MSKVKRFVTTCDCMSEAAWGDYVRHSDYAALEAERERLSQALNKIHDRCEAFVGDDSGMQVHSVEVLMDIAARGLGSSL